MIGRADIEGSKSNVAMNAWLPQASYPCGTLIQTREASPGGSPPPHYGAGSSLQACLSAGGRLYLRPPAAKRETHQHLVCELHPWPPERL
jgi:hypothetical protein